MHSRGGLLFHPFFFELSHSQVWQDSGVSHGPRLRLPWFSVFQELKIGEESTKIMKVNTCGMNENEVDFKKIYCQRSPFCVDPILWNYLSDPVASLFQVAASCQESE